MSTPLLPAARRPTRPILLLAMLLALLALAACSHRAEETQPGGATPESAMADSYKLLRDNDIDGLYRHALPPAEYAAMRARWGKDRDLSKFAPDERAQFDRMMAVLTAPGADTLLWAELKPKLAAARSQYQARLPTMIGMLQTMADTAVQRSTDLSVEEKTQAGKALDAIGTWAGKTDWLDPDKVHQVLGVVTATASKMDFRTLEQAMTLPYGKSMQDIGYAWSGIKQALAVYGLSVDGILDSAKIKVLSNDGNVAVVQTTFDVLGTPVTRENTLINQGGRWYDRSTLLHWQQILAPPASAAAPATATVPPAAPVASQSPAAATSAHAPPKH